MRFAGRGAVLFILALVLNCATFAGDKKADAKNNESGSPAAAAADSSTSSAAENSSIAATPTTPQDASGAQGASGAKKKSASAKGTARYEEAPKWTPMPALDGNPGLFTLETGEVLPKGGFDLAVSVNKISRMPGSVTVLQTVPAFGIGLTNRFSFFFQFEANDHIHVDQPSLLSLNQDITHPQLNNTIYRSFLPGTGLPAAYVEDYPFASHNGGGVGEVDFGFKIGLLSERRGNPVSLSIRNDFYIPTQGGFSDLSFNQVQYGNFNYGIGIEASKTILHRSIVATLNWAYRFTRNQSFNVLGGAPPVQVLNLADQMRAGFGMLMFPDKRINIITEYNALIFVGSGIANTSFGARDPIDNLTGFRVHLWKRMALDVGYRYTMNLSNHLDRNGFIVKLAGAYWPEKTREPDFLSSSCSVDKPSVMEGSNEILQASASASDAWGHPLTYVWTADGGKMDGSGPYARWDSKGVGPGNYTLTAHVDDGAGKTTSCSAAVTVQPKPAPPAPAMSCSTDRSTVLAGERSQVTATVNDRSGTALSYKWQSNGGQVIGLGETVQLDTSGLAPGTYTVTGRVENGAGGVADCSTAITVQSPPPPPQAAKIGECFFLPNSASVNNVCKRTLDDVAIRLQGEPKGKAVLVGFADPKESHAARLAAQRAEGAGKFLDTKQGVDKTRVSVRSSTGAASEARQNRRLDVVWVPDGATY